jgi:wyosine [tRNA(Phe)-imidazoG37] synthetase (radical SAM superfamily)
MEEFRSRYRGALWLEVFVVPGLNTTDEELAGLRSAIGRIDPDLVQLNTLDRPPAEGWVEAASEAELEQIRRSLGRPGIEIAGQRLTVNPALQAKTRSADLVRATLHRRPSIVEDLVRTTGMSGAEVAKILGALERAGEITSRRMERGVFYSINQGDL